MALLLPRPENRSARPARLLQRAGVGLGIVLIAACTPTPTGDPPDRPGACGSPSYLCGLPYPGPTDTPPAGADGFSPLTPTFLQLPDPIAPASIPEDGGEFVGAWEHGSGRRLQIRVEVSPIADERHAHNVLVIWPAGAYPVDSTVAVAVRTGPRTPSGRTVRARRGVIRPHGVPWTDILEATSFRVRSADMHHQVDEQARRIREMPHPVRSITRRPSTVPGTVVATGMIPSAAPLQTDGTLGATPPAPEWLTWRLTLPEHPPAGGAPVAVYVHGLALDRSSQDLVAARNAAAGVATIGVDLPGHGERTARWGTAQRLRSPADVPRLLTLLTQGVLDQIGLIAAVRAGLGGLDLVSGPDIDSSRITIMGTSLGAIVALTALDLEPTLHGAFIQVGGAGIADVIAHSASWGGNPGWSDLVPAPDAAALARGLATVQVAADGIDPGTRLTRSSGARVTVVFTEGDGVVGNGSTGRIATLLGLPSSDAASPLPSDGHVAVRLRASALDSSPERGWLRHLWFAADPIAAAAQDAWLAAVPRSTPAPLLGP